MEKKKILFGMILLFGIFLFSLTYVSAVGKNNYCAEKTIKGAWCQNVPLKDVDKNYRSAPTSCEATSYCKLGTCVDSQEGTCMENTPQKVCETTQNKSKGGVWFDSKVDEIPQCSLGCCLLGDQAAFVTQTRCKQLSSTYGLNTNYRTDIKSESTCIATATADVKGACIFEKESKKSCKFVTKGECGKMKSSENSTEFHEGFLCSAESLATNCGPSKKTTLVSGKDEIYFTDTCGNLANIYDANRQGDKSYWEKIVKKSNSCGFDKSNANSATCGNCNYFLGSTGKEYQRNTDSVAPKFGNNICRDLSCEYKGKKYQHGETWCGSSSKAGKNLPGSKYNRLVCYNGDVSVEPCAEFRQETCVQSEVNNFKTAACRVNKWQDCVSQKDQKDCNNIDKRDCQWTGNKCSPKSAPGFNFWKGKGDAKTLCAVASNNCIVEYKKSLLSSKYECVKNCQCLKTGWAEQQNKLCVSLGDCGSSTNYLGFQGYNSLNDLVTISESKKNKTSGGGFFG